MTQTYLTAAPAPRLHTQSSVLFLMIVLLLLVSSAAAAAQNPSPRFFYAASPSSSASSFSQQTKVRLLRETTDDVNANNNHNAAAEASCCQGAAADAAEPVTLPLELSLELGNVTADYTEADGSGETSAKDLFKRSVTRSAIRNATPASCSPQPTIVELKPPIEDTGANVYYAPACTRINRCSGCCGSTLISCQPTQIDIVQLRVRKVERGSTKREFAIVDLEQHLACKCGCRIKPEDCNAYQEYRKDLCRCECQNTDARNKCLEQTELKYWDDANCMCTCRYNQNCTTGTSFDESQCKCTDPSAPSDVFDRKRFIVQAVAVETDNSTLYSV